MSRTTVTIVRSDGRKVRTARSRRYYVTVPTGYEDKAWVAKRTDSISAAYLEARRLNGQKPEVFDLRTETFRSLEELERGHLAVLRRKRAERAHERAYNPNRF